MNLLERKHEHYSLYLCHRNKELHSNYSNVASEIWNFCARVWAATATSDRRNDSECICKSICLAM